MVYYISIQVKQIINPKRAGVITACIFFVFTFCSTPVYVVNRLGRIFSPLKNKTIVGLIFREDKAQIEMFTLAVINFFIPVCAFLIIVVSTITLSAQLHINADWRKRTTSEGQADKITSRNLKVSKMVVTMATLFIVCFAPITVIMMAVALEPDLNLNGKYLNITVIMSGFIYILEGINASMNIFIYKHMSTRYRDTFRTIFLTK